MSGRTSHVCNHLFYLFPFSPKSGINAVLTPVCFKSHIPYAVPVGSGLLSEAYSVVSVACGTVIYFFIHGVSENASALSDAAEETDSSVSKVVVALNQLIGNKEMYLVLGIFIITTLIVYVVRKLDIEHSWTVAWASGILFEAIGLTAGYILLGIFRQNCRCDHWKRDLQCDRHDHPVSVFLIWITQNGTTPVRGMMITIIM